LLNAWLSLVGRLPRVARKKSYSALKGKPVLQLTVHANGTVLRWCRVWISWLRESGRVSRAKDGRPVSTRVWSSSYVCSGKKSLKRINSKRFNDKMGNQATVQKREASSYSTSQHLAAQSHPGAVLPPISSEARLLNSHEDYADVFRPLVTW